MEGKGEFEVGIIEGAAFNTTVKRRDNDNNNIEENFQDYDENYTRSLPGAPENWEPLYPPDDWEHTHLTLLEANHNFHCSITLVARVPSHSE